MKSVIPIILIVIVCLVALKLYTELDRVVILDESVTQSWADIDAQLQRRFDLIPNVVNAVKGYMEHEKELLTELVDLREQWATANSRSDKIESSELLGQKFSAIMLRVENYPDLKAQHAISDLQYQLEGTENRIAVARKRYNDAAFSFNAYKRTILGGVVAKLRGLGDTSHPYFEASGKAKDNVTVDLSTK